MDRDELACRIDEALAARDRARKSMLFRPGRIHTADAAFVDAVCGLAGELAASLVAEVVERDRETRHGARVRGATPPPRGPVGPPGAPAPLGPVTGKAPPSQGRRNAPRTAKDKP